MLESRIQAEIVAYLQAEKIFRHSVPNEAAGNNAIRVMQMISMGLFSGVGDLTVWWPLTPFFRTYPIDPETGEFTYPVEVGYVEVKQPGKKQSKKQIRFQRRCERHRVPYLVVYSVEDVRNELVRRGLV